MSRTAFENRHTAELSTGGMFALWCLRKRVEGRQLGDDTPMRLQDGFDLAGIPSAQRHFEQLFDWLTGTGARPIRLGPPKGGQISRDEGLLLTALAALQRGDRKTGELLLGCFMPRAASVHGASAAASFAGALRLADLPVDLAPRPADTDVRRPANDDQGFRENAPTSARVH